MVIRSEFCSRKLWNHAGLNLRAGSIVIPSLSMSNITRHALYNHESATIVTLLAFVALTTVAFVTHKNFSFRAPFLMWGGMLALGMIEFFGSARRFDGSVGLRCHGDLCWLGRSLRHFKKSYMSTGLVGMRQHPCNRSLNHPGLSVCGAFVYVRRLTSQVIIQPHKKKAGSSGSGL
jgi:hypothetical protein